MEERAPGASDTRAPAQEAGRSRLAGIASPLLWVGAIAALLWLIFPFGEPNYDTLYALVWGDELANGVGPDYGTQPPTPHPVADAWGALVSPLGAARAVDATAVIAYLSLGAIAYLVYRLGSSWFDRPIGAVAALLVITRVPYLSNGLRAFVDLPFVALALGALLIETKRPRAGWPVLALLALAGLLRPEAWLFSVVYLAYLLLERDCTAERVRLRLRAAADRRQQAIWIAIAAAGPVVWALFDLVTTGNPVYSFTSTRDTVELLERHTGPLELITYGPHELAQAMSVPGLIAGAAGIVLAIAFLRRRARLPLAAAILAGISFGLLGIAGLAIISRYMLLGAALLCVFGAVALLGWRLLPGTDPWRRRWQAIAAVVLLALIVGAPTQVDDVSQAADVLSEQQAIGDDLQSLADSGAFEDGCRPILVPGVQAVPRLSLWLDLPPSAVRIATPEAPAVGYALVPATDDVAFHYGAARPPPGFRLAARNDSWALFRRCR